VPLLPHKHGEKTVQLAGAGQEGSGRIALARVRGEPSHGLGLFGSHRRQQQRQCQERVVVVKSRSRYVWRREAGMGKCAGEGRGVYWLAETRTGLVRGNDDDD